MPTKAVILSLALVALALPEAGLARADAASNVPAAAQAPCNNDRPDPRAIIEQARANGFTIAPGAQQALERVPDLAGSGRVLVGSKGPRNSAVRAVQSVKRITAGDVTALGCPVGSAAHVNWTSGSGVVQEYWHWATIGGQTGTSSPGAGTCSFTTCNWYAWANGVQNRYYRSVSVYNTWYAFIVNSGCGY